MYHSVWRKTSNVFDAILVLLSFLILGHVLCSRPSSSSALAHSHHHQHHHHQQYHTHHHSSGNPDGTTTTPTTTTRTTASANDESSQRKRNNGGPGRLPSWINVSGRAGTPSLNNRRERGPCRYRRCGVGRECRVSESTRLAECSCIRECKKEEKDGKSNNKPVCGTDGRLYPSYCDLRKTACLTGVQIFFSHYYQHQQYYPHHHYDHLYPDDSDASSSRYTERHTNFRFGGPLNESISYVNHNRNNFIPSRGKDPECFPLIQPQQQNYQHRNLRRQHELDKNPPQDKDEGFARPQSPHPSVSTTVMEQRHGLVKNEIQSLAEYYDGGPNNDKNDDDEDDDDVDDHEADYEVDEQNQYHKSPSSTGIKKTISTENEDDGLSQPESNKKNHDDDINFEEDEEDEKVDIGGDNNAAGSGNTLEMRSFQYIPRTYNHKQHHQVNQQPPNNNYPSVITRSEKGRKISSKRTNGLVDSRHISSEPVHSNPKDSSSSSYFNFMEYNKDNAQGEKAMRIKKKVVNSVEDEFRWRKDDQNGEMSDQAIPSRQQPEHDDETFATFQEKEMLDPSAVTNLAWKSSMVHPKKEISKRKDNQKNDHITFGNGHWDDPVKKDSSFAKSPGQVDQSVGGSKKRGSFNLPSSNSHQQLPQQQQLSSSDGKSGSTSVRHNICSPQDYEILKGELFQYDMGKLMNHMKLMTSVSNEVVADPNADEAGAGGVYVRYPREVMEGNRNAPWSDMMMASTSSPSLPSPWLNNVEGDGPEADKDNLLRHIFTLLDRNHDSVLEYVELYKAELENRLELRSPEKTGCQFRDFLLFDDTDHDGQLHVNEFFSSFSHFYDITMISLDKALETKYARVVEGDTVVLQCDITGSPPPYIRWKRYGADLSHMVGSGIKSNIDGTLALTNIHMTHAGHYSCQSPRNPEVVQTHILIVETQPYVLISPKASWKRPGEDLLLICRLVLPIMDSSSEEGSTNGRSISATKTDATPERGSVNWTWLFNGIPLRELPKSDNSNNSDNNNNHNNKYIFENSTSPDEGAGGGSGISRLRIREIYFQDSGSYTCQAELDLAGIGLASSSLVVIDPNSKPELQALHNINAKQLLVFHRNGLASYSAEHCGWLWEIFGDDVVQLSKEGDGMARAVCDQFHGVCDWGNAVQVSPNYVYALQSSLNRVLLIDVGAVQSVGNAVGSIETCSNPTRIHYVPYTDQLWIKCEEVDKKGHRKQTSVFSVVEKASKGDQHHNLQHKAIQFPFQRRDAPASSGNHPGSSEGPERITEIYLPSHQDGKRGKKDCQFAFVWSVTDEQSLRRIDLKTFTYHKNGFLNLTKFSCIPHQIHFSLSCTISIINCLDPKTKSPNGQVVVDTLSNTVRFKTAEISGTSIVSPDNRILLTEKHVGNNTHVFVQRVGVYEINLLSHFLLGNIFHNIRVVHSTLTGAYASVAKSQMGKEAVLSLETGEIQIVDELQRVVPHSSRYTSLYPADNAFPLKTDKSVIVMDAETLRPRCKFYEEIPELQSFLTVQS